MVLLIKFRFIGIKIRITRDNTILIKTSRDRCPQKVRSTQLLWRPLPESSPFGVKTPTGRHIERIE